MSTKTSEIVWQVDVPGWQIVTVAHNSFTFVQTFEVPTETGYDIGWPGWGRGGIVTATARTTSEKKAQVESCRCNLLH